MNKKASLVQEVESSKLGVFEFEKKLKGIALKSGLEAVKVISQTQNDQEGIVPVKISFQSNFGQAMKWLDFFKMELPYAVIQSFKFVVNKPAEKAEFEASINYRYNLSSR